MLSLDVNHPDLEEFIDVKTNLDKVTKANISIMVNDEFMKAVKNKEKYTLSFTVESTGEVIEKEIDAREVFRKLALNNWRVAEPGILYWSRIENYHLMSEDEDFEYVGVNPCAEEPLPKYGSCLISSLNLSTYVKNPFTDKAKFDFDKFSTDVKHMITYLNEILDEGLELHPLQSQRETARDLRQIGGGIMGLADCFIKLGIRYGSEDSLRISNEIGSVMINSALQQSALLAKDFGTFPKYKADKVLQSDFLKTVATQETLDLIKKYGLRNSQVLTAAPTGSIATMLGCSNGIEPLFNISYTRKTESLHDEAVYYKVFTPVVKEYMDFHNILDEKDLPDFFNTAMTLNYKERIDMQSTWQQYIDASISSTVNVPNEFTVDEVEELYICAWEKGLKGVTIYRDGCERSGILTNSKPSAKKNVDELKMELDKAVAQALEENPNECPMCGGIMNRSGGCSECQDCGYSPCGV